MDDSELELFTQKYGPITARAFQIMLERNPTDDPTVESLLLDQAILATKMMKPPPTLEAIAALLKQDHNIDTRIIAPGDRGFPPVKSPLYRIYTNTKHLLWLLGDKVHIGKFVQRKNVNGTIYESASVLEEVSSSCAVDIADPNSIRQIAERLKI